MAKGSFQFRRAVARCHVLEPVSTAGLTLADLPALKERVRALIDETRHRLERDLGILPPAGGATTRDGAPPALTTG